MTGGKPDTIIAAATPPGRGGVAVIRLSGPLVLEILTELTNGKPRSWFSMEIPVILPTGKVNVKLYYMKSPYSYTREDCGEIHLPAVPVLIESLLTEIVKLGARIAEPGEFTRRAFLNGRISLEEAEGVIDLINATSEAELQAARFHLQGLEGAEIHQIISQIGELRMEAELPLDFSDDIEDPAPPVDLENRIGLIIKKCRSIISDGSRNTVPLVLLAGKPNSGKSTLFNHLLGKERAVTANENGTTVDKLSEYLTLKSGFQVMLADTPGIWSSNQIERCDLLILVSSSDSWPPLSLNSSVPAVKVYAKCDLTDNVPEGFIPVSSVKGTGVRELEMQVEEKLQVVISGTTGINLSTSRRAVMEQVIQLLYSAQYRLNEGMYELAAFDLDQALSELTQSMMNVTKSEDIIDMVFNRFCIGK